MVKCEKYSSRVCNPCARKIRNLGSLYSFVKKSTEGEISKSTPANKRLLDTPEGRSPIRKSVRVFSPVTKTNNEKSGRLVKPVMVKMGKTRVFKYQRRKIAIISTLYRPAFKHR